MTVDSLITASATSRRFYELLSAVRHMRLLFAGKRATVGDQLSYTRFRPCKACTYHEPTDDKKKDIRLGKRKREDADGQLIRSCHHLFMTPLERLAKRQRCLYFDFFHTRVHPRQNVNVLHTYDGPVHSIDTFLQLTRTYAEDKQQQRMIYVARKTGTCPADWITGACPAEWMG